MRIAPTSFAFTLLLGLFAGLPALSIDLSAPTLVELPGALNTTTTVAGMTLSLFMLGFALGQLVGGRVSDRRGRRPVLLVSLTIYTAAGVACAFANSGAGLTFGRFLQGVGAGGCFVLAYAMVQDLFEGEAARLRRSHVTVVLGVLPVLAPSLGILLDWIWGWRSVHAVLALGGCLLLALSAATLSECRRSIPSVKAGRLREDSRFLGVCVVNALSYGTIFAYIAGAPVVVMGQMHYPAMIYATLFAMTALALSAGAWTSGWLGKSGIGAARLAWPALALQAVSCLALALLCGQRRTALPLLGVALLILTGFGRGIAAPNLIHLAIEHRRQDAGLASALFGVLQLAFGAASSAAVAFLLPVMGPMGLATPMALTASAAALLWLAVIRRKVQPLAPAADGS